MKKLVVLAIIVLGIKRLATMCDRFGPEGSAGGRARHDGPARFRGKVSV
jgi:hypothetical protein